MHASLHWSQYNGAEKSGFPDFTKTMEAADSLLRYIANLYGLSISVPEIKVRMGPEFIAFANSNREIHMSEGVLRWAARLSQYQRLLDSPEASAFGRAIVQNTIFWIVAHELAHIGRAHFEINDLRSYPDGSLAFEFDADNIATAVLVRLMTQGFANEKGMTPLLIKHMVLDTIFWPIRAFINEGRSELPVDLGTATHPPWQTRLICLADKLALQGNGYAGEPGPSKEYQEEHLIFVKSVLHRNSLYQKHHGLPDSEDDPFSAFLDEETFQKFLFPVRNAWFKIEPDVNRLQYFQKLRNPNL